MLETTDLILPGQDDFWFQQVLKSGGAEIILLLLLDTWNLVSHKFVIKTC